MLGCKSALCDTNSGAEPVAKGKVIDLCIWKAFTAKRAYSMITTCLCHFGIAMLPRIRSRPETVVSQRDKYSKFYIDNKGDKPRETLRRRIPLAWYLQYLIWLNLKGAQGIATGGHMEGRTPLHSTPAHDLHSNESTHATMVLHWHTSNGAAGIAHQYAGHVHTTTHTQPFARHPALQPQCGYKAQRVGEAKRPGPLQQMDGLTKHTLMTINVNSEKAKRSWLQKDAEVICMQETRLTARGQQGAKRSWANVGYDIAFDEGAQMRTQRANVVRETLDHDIGAHGVGVAIASQFRLHEIHRNLQSDHYRILREQCRGQIAFVDLGNNKGYYVANFYGISGASCAGENAAYRRNEELLTLLFTMLSRLKGPVFLCGDFNVDCYESVVARAALNTECWVNLNAEKATTYHRSNSGTCIDQIWVNRPALALVEPGSFRVRHDIKSGGHHGLQITIQTDSMHHAGHMWNKLKAIPTHLAPEMTDDDKQQLAWEIIQAQGGRHMVEHILEGRTNQAYNIWIRTLEEYWEQRLTTVDASWDRGRAAPPQFVRKSVIVHRDNFGPGIRKLDRTSLQRMLQRHDAGRTISIKEEVQMMRSWKNMTNGLHSKLKHIPDIRLDEPSLGTTTTLQAAAYKLRESILQSIAKARIGEWREKMTTSLRQRDTKNAYKWVRNQATYKQRALLVPDDSTQQHDGTHQPKWTTNVDHVMGRMMEYWKGLFNMFVDHEPRVADFLREYESEIPDMVDTPTQATINGTTLGQALDDANTGTSTGLDSVAIGEIQHLPIALTGPLATILNKVGTCPHAPWPTPLTHARIPLLDKGAVESEGDARPIRVYSNIYRGWSRASYRLMTNWMHSWMPEGMIGGRKGHSATSITWQTQLGIELAANSDQQSVACMYDRVKCFDRIVRPIVYAVEKQMGMPDWITTASRKFYDQLNNSLQLGPFVGEFFHAGAGLGQGCALSVMRINVLMCIWLRRHLSKLPKGYDFRPL